MSLLCSSLLSLQDISFLKEKRYKSKERKPGRIIIRSDNQIVDSWSLKCQKWNNFRGWQLPSLDEAEVAWRPLGLGSSLDYRCRVLDNWWHEHWHQQESWLSLRQTGTLWARCQSVQWVWETDQMIHHKQWQRRILSKVETSFWNNRGELGEKVFL